MGSKTDSNEYEWDSLSELSCDKKDIDVVHEYDLTSVNEGQSPRARPLEFVPHDNYSENHEEGMSPPLTDLLMENTTVDLIHTSDNFVLTINTSEPDQTSNPLPLINPELIDWDLEGTTLELDTFENDEAIIDYLDLRNHIPARDHRAGYAIELNAKSYFGESAKPFSHKNVKIKEGSNGENCSATALDHQNSKNKDASNDENLSEALKDGRLDPLPNLTHQERSSILIEPAEPTNVNTEDEPKMIYMAKALTEPEKSTFTYFFKRKQVNFTWT